MTAHTDTRAAYAIVGTIDDIPAQGARCVTMGETRVAVFRTADDRIFALEDRCPHRGGPLSQGIVHDGCVTCPLHNWVISLQSGRATGADDGATCTFDVRLEGRTIHLAMRAND
ncbi:nitrite reductase (NAD(P)H) small subunit [Acuticoccus sediminis]|uniref:Nitrite reductase (NAD(P)H) small subunit n=1 Tax=Acuticoccus sediminis TaxID=2184697 RepID=A0A8B2NZY4_9HYPH|nr:nitrite reductase small subunit NirD [Acuticoccus sediminis]RAI03264.1 nitrite reductase (NAD(P)H) small subunit [Acuticoccus sediminis]